MEGGKERRGGGLKDNYIDLKELGVELIESRAQNSKKHSDNLATSYRNIFGNSRTLV